MKGLNLKTFRLDLHKIEPDSQTPAETISDWSLKLGPWVTQIVDWYGENNFDFRNEYYRLPLKMFKGFSFDELCKLYYSSVIMMHRTVVDLFEKQAQYEIVRKIANSMWRWSSKGTWNEVADAYNRIRNFQFLEDPDFEIRLDHSTWFNERGYSKYSRTFLDGTFGFLVYYQRKHVLTIGFSILSGRRLLIQQVQSAQRSGNRSLYKLPKNRIEFVIDLFQKNFAGYELYVIDGHGLVERILNDYRRALQMRLDDHERWARNPSWASYLPKIKQDCDELRWKIAHLEVDGRRLVALYNDTGSYRLGGNGRLVALGLLHHPIIAAA